MKLRKSTLVISALSSLWAWGCADVEGNDGESEVTEVAAQTAGRDPNAITFDTITPRGSGCRAGTWYSSVSSDGLAFTLTFSEFFVNANLQDTTTSQSKDCTLSIKVKTPAGVSYAVSRFSYSGYVFLEGGVSAEQSASYNFLGQVATDIRTKTTRWKGPADEEFVISDDVPTRDWSVCGDTRTLLINNNITVNNPQKKSGYLNQRAIDGYLSPTENSKLGRIEIAFAKRACPTK